MHEQLQQRRGAPAGAGGGAPGAHALAARKRCRWPPGASSTAARAVARGASPPRAKLAASVAHELRNPLAGIQMTLSNLRAEIQDQEVGERLDAWCRTRSPRLTATNNSLLDSAAIGRSRARVRLKGVGR
ncbi:MAG: histidine kinase dimerization/phospho-acceptor domain-containing protein [Candidatus Binatia bacterium]